VVCSYTVSLNTVGLYVSLFITTIWRCAASRGARGKDERRKTEEIGGKAADAKKREFVERNLREREARQCVANLASACSTSVARPKVWGGQWAESRGGWVWCG